MPVKKSFTGSTKFSVRSSGNKIFRKDIEDGVFERTGLRFLHGY